MFLLPAAWFLATVLIAVGPIDLDPMFRSPFPNTIDITFFFLSSNAHNDQLEEIISYNN
jgi:hypothetical protein